MDSDQAAQVDILTQSICAQGPAYQHDPAYLDGWCVLVPMVNDDGSPLVDSNDQQIYDYQFSDQTSIDLKPAIEAILCSVKNDPSLEGEHYTVIYHGDPVDEDALPEANPPVLDSNEAPALKSGGGDSVTFSNLGYHHDVLF